MLAIAVGLTVALVFWLIARWSEDPKRAEKRERKLLEKNKRQFLEALNQPVTEEYLLSHLQGPNGELPEVRQALDALKAKLEGK